MTGSVRNDGRVNFCPARRPGRWLGRWPGPAAAALLAGLVLAGCGSAAPAGGTGAGRPVTGSGPASAGPESSPTSPRDTAGAGSHSIISKRETASASPGVAAGHPGSGSGCSPWPAGSTSTTLLLTPASNGGHYCVDPGQGVQVFLTGQLTPKSGAEPPRLTGTGLVPAGGQAHLLRSPAAAYRAAQAGQAVLTVVRMPCQSVSPAQTPAPVAGAWRESGAAGPGSPGSGTGPPSAGSPPAADPPAPARAVELAHVGGAPVGPQCTLQQALRVTIVVA